MRRLPLLALGLLLGCAEALVADDPDVLADVEAVVQVAPGGLVVLRAEPDGGRFVPYPEAFPAAFAVDGLRVVFSGRRLPIPPNVRLAGSPVEITAIARVP